RPGIAAGRALLLQQIELLLLGSYQLGRDISRPGMANAEMTDRAGFAAGVEREDHRRGHPFETCVVVADPGPLLAEELPVAGNGRVEVCHIQSDVKRLLGHGSILLHRSLSMRLHRPSTSVNIELCR